MNDINKLISLLIVIAEYSKGVHYSCKGDAFYGKHLLADRVYDGIYTQIDDIKESYLLANELEALQPADYLKEAAANMPQITADDKANFGYLKAKIIETLGLLDSLTGLTTGEQSLFDDISKSLQSKLGLINRQVA